MQIHISNAILKLPEKQRSVLILREIQDMSYKDISASLDMPINSVKVTILRGREALKNILSQMLKSELKDVAG